MADVIQKIVFKRGTKAALEAKLIGANKPLKGEPIFESDTNKFKIGNGNDNYADLPYISGGEGPNEYIKSASLSQEGKVLTLTKQDGTTVVFDALLAEETARATKDTELEKRIEALETGARFLSSWDAATGLPGDYPIIPEGASSPYTYTFRSGDYYIVSNVPSTGTKYMPKGGSITATKSGSTWTWTIGKETTTAEISANDTYIYSSSAWSLIHTPGIQTVWGQIGGTLSNQTDLQNALNTKSDKTYVDTELAKKQDILNEYLKTAVREGNKLTITKKDGTQETFEVTASTTGTATTEAKYITINGTEYKLAGSDSSKLTEVYINPNNNKQMVFKFADGTDLNCDLSSLFPNIVKDTSATSISYTLVDNEEKAYSANNISNLNIIIPSTIAQGFLNILNFKTAENTTWTVNNQSSVSLKYFYDGIQVDSLPTLLNNYYYSVGTIHNGLNICMYIRVNT